MPSVADKVETTCQHCDSAFNVRTTLTEDGDLLNLCGHCRYSAAAQVDKVEALDEIRHNRMMGGYYRPVKTVHDPRTCANCTDDAQDGADLCETCLDAEI